MTLPNTVDTGAIDELEALVAIDDDIKREKGADLLSGSVFPCSYLWLYY